MSETKVPALPPIPTGTDPALYKWLQAVQQIVQVREGQKGDALDANVTFRDLIDAGIAVSGSYKPNPNTGSPVNAAAVSDSTPPPDPFNIGVTGNVESVLITWELPAERANLAFIKVWRSVDNNFGNAAIAGTGVGSIYVDYDVIPGTNYRYWLQAISKSNVEGAVIDAGSATPTSDPSTQLTQLKSFGVEGQPYYYVPTDTVVNGVTIPKGTYMWNAMIGTATIGTAQIKDAAITTAKIANLTADKITFNQANGQVFNAAVITGGLITGTTIQGNTVIGGEIQGSRIWAGGSSTDPNIELNGATGAIRTYDTSVLDPTKRRYTEMFGGDVTAYEYFPQVGFTPAKALTQVQAGVANNSETVVLPGYWKEPPSIIVSLNSLQIYNAAAGNADQRVVCAAENISRLSQDINNAGYYRYSFTPRAYITTSASNGLFPVAGGSTVTNPTNLPLASGPTGLGGTFNSIQFTIPSFTTGLVAPMFINIYGINDVNGGDREADFWVGYVTVNLVINGVVAWSNGQYAQGYTNAGLNFTVTTGALPAGTAYFQYVVTPVRIVNNGGYAYDVGGFPKRVITISSVGVYTSGGSALATGALSWVAIGR